MDLDGNSCVETSVAFLKQVRANHTGPLIIIRDNGPAHGGEAIREYLATPDLAVRLPGHSPDYNADEQIRGWVREDVTAITCLGTKAAVQEQVGAFFTGPTKRTEEVKRRCRTKLQADVVALTAGLAEMLHEPTHVDSICALV